MFVRLFICLFRIRCDDVIRQPLADVTSDVTTSAFTQCTFTLSNSRTIRQTDGQTDRQTHRQSGRGSERERVRNIDSHNKEAYNSYCYRSFVICSSGVNRFPTL